MQSNIPCQFYTLARIGYWSNGHVRYAPYCRKGRKASSLCTRARPKCPDYKPLDK